MDRSPLPVDSPPHLPDRRELWRQRRSRPVPDREQRKRDSSMQYSTFPPYDYATMQRNATRGRVISGFILTGLGLAFSLGLWPIGYLGGANEAFSASAHIGPWMIPGFTLF